MLFSKGSKPKWANQQNLIFLAHKSKSIGSTEKLDLSLESPQDAGYLCVGYFKMASSKSGLINKISCFWPKLEKLPGAQKPLTYRWKALRKLYIYPLFVFKGIQAKVA